MLKVCIVVFVTFPPALVLLPEVSLIYQRTQLNGFSISALTAFARDRWNRSTMYQVKKGGKWGCERQLQVAVLTGFGKRGGAEINTHVFLPRLRLVNDHVAVLISRDDRRFWHLRREQK